MGRHIDRRIAAALYVAQANRKLEREAPALFNAPRSATWTLPMPPSVNALYRAGAGVDAFRRFLVPEQREYRRLVACVVGPTFRTFANRLILVAELHYKNRRVTDIDNRLQALFNALKHARAIADDSLIDELHAFRRISPAQPECCIVHLTEIGNNE